MNNKGETLAEALVTFLIVVTSSVILISSILVTEGRLTNSLDSLHSFNQELFKARELIAGAGEGNANDQIIFEAEGFPSEKMDAEIYKLSDDEFFSFSF